MGAHPHICALPSAWVPAACPLHLPPQASNHLTSGTTVSLLTSIASGLYTFERAVLFPRCLLSTSPAFGARQPVLAQQSKHVSLRKSIRAPTILSEPSPSLVVDPVRLTSVWGSKRAVLSLLAQHGK